jgi:hypothetical protein
VSLNRYDAKRLFHSPNFVTNTQDNLVYYRNKSGGEGVEPL